MSESHDQILSLLQDHLIRLVLFCAASAVLSLVSAFFGGKRGRWFSVMTLVWVLINLLVVYWLHSHILQPFPGSYFEHVLHIKTLMWINLILDVLYGLVGWWLWSRRSSKWNALWEGFAFAVWVQAGGLLVLDSILLVQQYYLL